MSHGGWWIADCRWQNSAWCLVPDAYAADVETLSVAAEDGVATSP